MLAMGAPVRGTAYARHFASLCLRHTLGRALSGGTRGYPFVLITASVFFQVLSEGEQQSPESKFYRMKFRRFFDDDHQQIRGIRSAGRHDDEARRIVDVHRPWTAHIQVTSVGRFHVFFDFEQRNPR